MTRSAGILLLAALVSSGCRPSRGGHATGGALTVTHAVIPAPTSRSEASVFLVIENGSDTAAALTGALTPAADSVMLHRLVGGLMQPAMPPVIPARGYLDFVPGGYHLMMEGLRRPLAVGDTVTVELRFDAGRALTVRVPVLTYTEAVSELPLR
ncbi:MAG TPA: copper chaperone PCu(A)C [Gemmatimonadales bacterium]|nr:copper chaperone PCu(A)C [Gemmatimonadales bacterium]